MHCIASVRVYLHCGSQPSVPIRLESGQNVLTAVVSGVSHVSLCPNSFMVVVLQTNGPSDTIVLSILFAETRLCSAECLGREAEYKGSK